MNLGLLALFAFTPILLAAVLSFALRMPAKRAMPVVFIASGIIAYFAWNVSLSHIAAVLITYFLHRMNIRELSAAVLESVKILLGAGFVLIFTVPIVRIYINSGINFSGLESMPITLARWVAATVGNVWLFLRRSSSQWAHSSPEAIRLAI